MADGLLSTLEIADSRSAASRAAADLLADALAARLAREPRAAIAVSGGTTPAEALGLLADSALPWARVQVTLTDERQVPVDDPASNEGMLRRTLLRGPASIAEFVPLGAATDTALPETFAAVLLGMGEDGHFASIFPDLPDLAAALDPDGGGCWRDVRTSASPVPRRTLDLSRLLASELVVLLAFGDAKRTVLEAPGTRPVATLLAQTRTPLRVLWAS